jgi:hypothetical protein
MKQRTTLLLTLAGATIISVTALFTPGCTCGPVHESKPTRIEHVTYHGWADALRLTSEQSEVISCRKSGAS